MSSNSRKTNSSYYCFNGVPYIDKPPGAQKWMYAEEARRQQAKVELEKLLEGKQKPKYPRDFWNHKNEVELSTPGSAGQHGKKTVWEHHPLIPGQDKPWREGPPGAVRSVWTRGDAENFDVIVHDKSRGFTKRNTPKFANAKYHPALPTQPENQQQQDVRQTNPAVQVPPDNE
ncbi:hypothetical protein B0T25DRAFT_569140 [Lasiosphaeria hispida]|uniref:Uncharacterized protein n=1 Tax=Lasiosphaeria hispida TaxID=260671 RepID=A0AAJ0HK04_9PEZI|nr:hypothetical protein B0T25DRAFT_569140 [Lasiosphaeria hispida]